ncbi:MAG TPA: dodecin [Flexivirga sp.]|uniref:dodecin n=1 Tax=Flexivirga sp. TaxID=1962927 RepID=UPI002CFE7AB1|nr:dodecin [Flexivirga sp.]HWC21674.1 dodecin [Flexivirga sp.]
MANHAYGLSEIVGTSPEGIESAINNAVSRAGSTVRNLDWFEVQGIRGQLDGDKVVHWQVTVKVGFRIDE